MKMEPDDLAAIADAVVQKLHSHDAFEQLLRDSDWLGRSEAEAAQLLGIAKHVLRDCRLRGEITAARVGKGWIYSRKALIEFLQGGSD